MGGWVYGEEVKHMVFKAISAWFTKLHINKGGMTYFECRKCGYGYFGSQSGTT